MARRWNSRRVKMAAVFCLALFIAAGAVRLASLMMGPITGTTYAKSLPPRQMPASDPWSSEQAVQPADFAKELTTAKGAGKPIVVCAGFRMLYIGAHIPGASFHGPGNSPQGLDDLKKWAQDVPRSAKIVVYCGCCPLWHCPNIRPAFSTLRDMGFTHLRVLLLPTNFNDDWIAKGYAIEKGQ